MPGPPSPYYGSDYVVIETSGATFAVLADPVYNGTEGLTTYIQIYKMAYGPSGSYTVIDSGNPMPVTVSGGMTATISGFTGTISIQGVVSGTAVPVSGSVVVSGISSAPVYVQTATNCRVEITGGRNLSRLTDSVSCYGPAGSTFLYATPVDASGAAFGTTGNPINVSLIGVSATVNLSATVGVTNDVAGNGLRIQGMSGGTSVNTTVDNTVAINDTALLAGITAIYGQVVTLNASLGAIGAARPSSFQTDRVSSAYPTQARLDATGFTCQNGINIKALSTNTDFVYIGNTAGFAGASGYALDPGDETFLSIVNTNKLWILANSGTQTITYMAS